MAAVAEEKDAYRAGFERFAAAHAGSDPAWLRERRTAAVARFVEKGLPTARDEAWRHTPVAPLAKGRFDAGRPRRPSRAGRARRAAPRRAGAEARLRQRAALAGALGARPRPGRRRRGEPP